MGASSATVGIVSSIGERELGEAASRTFTRTFLVANSMTFLTFALGAILLAFLSPIASMAYAAYCVGSTFGIWRFVCVNCPYYGAVCPCGYSTAASRLFKKGDERLLPQSFILISLLVAPSWIVPVLAAIQLLVMQFSWALLSFTAAFAVVAFALAPALTRVVGCCDYWRGCPSPKTAGAQTDAQKEAVQ